MSSIIGSNSNNNKPKFWKPGESAPGNDTTIERDDNINLDGPQHNNNTINYVYNPNNNLPLSQQRELLPIAKYRKQLLYAIETHAITIVTASTGTGKTSQLPQYLYQAGWTSNVTNNNNSNNNSMPIQKICITQPSRIAASSIAKRVSLELNCEVGSIVGYNIRFDNNSSNLTHILYMTEGILLQELLYNPLLLNYSVIILDEIHERTANTDILLGLLMKIMKVRNDLRLVISSATLNVQQYIIYFQQYFNKNQITAINIDSFNYPVEIYYTLNPVDNYCDAIIETINYIINDFSKYSNKGNINNNSTINGDILVFLTGKEEIEKTKIALNNTIDTTNSNILVLSLYAGLSQDKINRVFEPINNTRKIILSTNIAEASVTIPNILIVIDCGFNKLKYYNPNNNLESLLTVPISQQSAIQRGGRAGRTQYGYCFRLYTESDYNKLNYECEPEIKRINIINHILLLKYLGINNVLNFPWLNRPYLQQFINCFDCLYALNIIDNEGNLLNNYINNNLSLLPIPIQYAKIIMTALQNNTRNNNIINDILACISMCCIDNIYNTNYYNSLYYNQNREKYDRIKLKFATIHGDLLTYINIFNNYNKIKESNTRGKREFCDKYYFNYYALNKAQQIYKQLQMYLKNMKINNHDIDDLTGNKGDDTSRISSSSNRLNTIIECIISGLFINAAQLQSDGTYRNLQSNSNDGASKLYIHSSSVLSLMPISPAWIVYGSVLEINNKLYMRDICVINNIDMLLKAAPHYFNVKTNYDIMMQKQNLDTNNNTDNNNKAIKHRKLF